MSTEKELKLLDSCRELRERERKREGVCMCEREREISHNYCTH